MSSDVPEGDVAESTVKPLIGVVRDGPATADLGMFSVGPAVWPAGGRPPQAPEVYGLGPVESASRRAPRHHRRASRRPRFVTTLAIAGSVLTIGAVALTVRLLSGPDVPDRALPDNNPSRPELILPSGDATDGTNSTTPSASPSADVSASPSASPSAVGSASALSSTSAAPASSTASGPSTASAGSGNGTSTVLRPGDRGSEVVTLQGRLETMGLYDQEADGKYDGGVREAVSRYQQEYGVQGDADGIYGPNTRRSLESATS